MAASSSPTQQRPWPELGSGLAEGESSLQRLLARGRAGDHIYPDCHKGLNPEAGWGRTWSQVATWSVAPRPAQAPPPPRPSARRPRPLPWGPLRRSICIRRRLPAPPSAHVTPGRRREPADLTRAVLRLPLARNSKNSRDLRPRPPAANKSAGRLQTQNFHVGKSQDGRERSGALTGSLAQRPGAQRTRLRHAGGPL